MYDWLTAQLACEQSNQTYVLVTVMQVKGSSPISSGAKMLITNNKVIGTIGGGHLEHKATKKARQWLNERGVVESGLKQKRPCFAHTQDYALGANLGQCCGGQVTLLYEYRSVYKMPVAVFGAGHVGQALVPILAQLPVAVRWIDSRHNLWPKTLPSGVKVIDEEYPVDQVSECLQSTCYLIMTHHHGLDLDIAKAALARQDSVYVGVIGSASKGMRFRHRLQNQGFANAMQQFACPMGLAGIQGKLPMEVAVAIAAEVMRLYQTFSNQTELKPTELKPTELKPTELKPTVTDIFS